MTHRNTDIAVMMNIYKCSEAEAVMRLDMYEAGRQLGRVEGRSQAQRFFQLALGLTEPTLEEFAMWNNPVPLMVPEGLEKFPPSQKSS
jgi:hypothetical protein